MDENEQNEIKPTEYKEIGEFTESPGYTPAAEPLEKFETFEGYGANEPEESPSEAETAKEPNPANEVAPETEPTVEPANEVQPESSLFAELDGFKEVENFPEPVPEPEAVTDFSTGHWAVDPKPQSGTPQTVMETRQTESLILPDDIPTIPPQAEDLPKAAEIQPEPLPQVVEVVDPQATVLASTAFANSVGTAKEGI